MTYAETMSLRPEGDHLVAHVDASWGQGRATFGGVIGALAARAAATRVQGRLRSAATSFYAPMAPGPVRVEPRVVRAGRAVQHVAVELVQDDVVASCRLVYGEDRPTPLVVPPRPAPAAPHPDTLPALPYLEGITPVFTQYFDFRWAYGAFPFSGAAEARVGGYVRLREPVVPDVAMTLALLDAWPPPGFARLTAPAPGSTVSWHVVVVNEPDPAYTDGFYLYDGIATSCGGGFMDADAHLWGPDGRLLLTARQLIAEFSR